MVSTAGFLSSYQSINFSISSSSIVCLAKLTSDKSEETINVKLWREPSTANHGAGKHSIPQFYHGKKTATTWLLRGARPLILAWSELIFYIYVRKLLWMWFGRSFATLIALYWFRKNLLFNFHCSSWMVSSPREALILFLCDVKEFQRTQRHFHCI